MILFIAQIISYLIGGIPFGYLVAKFKAGIDIREHGSGNIGATNCGRILGFRYFILVFLLDFLKGALPVAAAIAFQSSALAEQLGATTDELFGLPVAVGFAAIVGHMFPIYLGLRGGKGVATSIGVIVVLAPIACLVGLAVWFVIVGLTRLVALASILFAIAFATTHLVLAEDLFQLRSLPMTLFVLIVAALVIIRHWSNITRMVQGTEAKIGLPWDRKSDQ